MTEDECAGLLVELAAAHRNWETRPGMLQVWHDALADLDIVDVRVAVRDWRRTEQWPPAIADLRRLVAVRGGLLAPDVDEALHGRLWGPGVHPVVVEVRDAVGDSWAWQVRDREWLNKEFREMYPVAKARHDRGVLSETGVIATQLGQAETKGALNV